MILNLNTYFEGYFLKEMFGESSYYREAYLTHDIFGKDHTIIVYDLKLSPEYYSESYIPELDVIKKSSNEFFPQSVNGGRYLTDNLDLLWIATEYIKGVTLTEFLKTNHDIKTDELMLQFHKMLIAIVSLSSHTENVCHNNINCDNIIVTTEEDGSHRLHLLGFECISKECNGNTPFDTSVQSKFYRAPETLLGRYNILTDIFSLGIVLAMCLQGKHPRQSVIDENKDLTLKSFIKSIRQQEPILDIPENLKAIVYKAIAVKPSLRYRSIEGFCMSIEEYLGIDSSERYCVEKFYSSEENKKTESLEENKDENDDDDDDSFDPFKPQSPAQPGINLKIECVSGNGFKDVAGMTQLKGLLTRNFIDIFKNSELAIRYKITPPNGLLLWGPPDNGKTFISRKLAEECGMMYCMIKPSDLGNIYIHGSQKLISDLFRRSEKIARKNKCGVLLVFDEFDSLVQMTDGFCASDISFIVKECARCSFQESLRKKQIVNISHEQLEKIINSTNPSVSCNELRRYEKLRENFERGRYNDRPKIGFNV